MAAITSPVITQVAPNAGAKMITVRCSMATGETFDASTYFGTIVACYLCEELGAVKTATWVAATRVVTMGTLSTGVHCLVLIGY